MRNWLVIQLAAPLGSFGELAGASRRGGRERPGKGALLGLVGAALGVRRDDVAGQTALAQGYEVAVRTLRSGAILHDFHTVQSLPRPHRAATRRDALSQKHALATSISTREYRQDPLFEAAFAAKPGARWSLEAVRDALKKPVFTVYLGRKSCPLAAPLDPRLVAAPTPIEAFEVAEKARPDDWSTLISPAFPAPQPIEIAIESESDQDMEATTRPRRRRRDQPRDRIGWHFEEREEIVIALPRADSADANARPPNGDADREAETS